ncbi:hypothetical protein EYB25_003436 [Talaromyces marneffei]|nr:hypothetical protein EYB25_003436 [Talaromyces marneffei]
MEIDDILASVDRDTNFSSPESVTIDHQHLTRLWVAERAVSELLPWPGQLMDRMMERVRKQVENIEDLTASSYENSNTDNNSANNSNNNKNNTLNLKLSILQTDLSRTQYLIRSYLRQRLSKITKFAMHYLVLISPPAPSPATQSPDNPESGGVRTEDTLPNPSSSVATSPLSESEAHFLYSHQYLLASHYRLSFLASFPPQLRRLDDNAGGTSMIQGPDMREVVVVRCLVPEVAMVVPADEMLDQEREGEVVMRMGEVWVGRWEGVKKAWEKGDVEIL